MFVASQEDLRETWSCYIPTLQKWRKIHKNIQFFS